MYNLLIVDDEPIVVDGLYELFVDREEMELEILRAYSGSEALEIMMKINIDVLLTDICMPDMDGFRIQEEIRRQWPECKVIFLTGFDDFEYVQSAVRNDSSDYILKTEDDEVIIHSVKKAIAELEEEVKSKRFIESARMNMQAALPLLQKKYLLELLEGGKCLNNSAEEFHDLKLPFDPACAVMLLIARIDNWGDLKSQSRKTETIYGLEVMAKEHFSKGYHFLSVKYDRTKLVWVIQPMLEKKESGNAAYSEFSSIRNNKLFVQGATAYLQRLCTDLLHISVSFGTSERIEDWNELSAAFTSLMFAINETAGIEEKTILIENGQIYEPEYRQDYEVRDVCKTNRKGKIALLQTCLEEGMQQEFSGVLDFVIGTGDASSFLNRVNMEIYYSIASLLLSHINSYHLYDRIDRVMELSKLMKMEEHRSWSGAREYFMELSEHIFELKKDNYRDQNDRVIRSIKNFVSDNIAGDLSITRIADRMHYNPSYLSRLFKNHTGESLTEYIADVKLCHAQRLLKNSNRKINEISQLLGFNTSSYFIRFFKKLTGFTPQEYRDLQRVG